jgi:hypothetical protein
MDMYGYDKSVRFWELDYEATLIGDGEMTFDSKAAFTIG